MLAAKRGLHARHALIRHALHQADIKLDLVPLDDRALDLEEGEADRRLPILGAFEDQVVERVADLPGVLGVRHMRHGHGHGHGMHGMQLRLGRLRLVHVEARPPALVDVWQHVLGHAIGPELARHIGGHGFGGQLVALVAVLHVRQGLQVAPVGHLVLFGGRIVARQWEDVINGSGIVSKMCGQVLRAATNELECDAALLALASQVITDASPHQALELEHRVGLKAGLVDALRLRAHFYQVLLPVYGLLRTYLWLFLLVRLLVRLLL